MARRMAGRGLDQHGVIDRMLALEQDRLSGFDHRQDAVAIRDAALRVCIRRRIAARVAVIVLLAREQVFGIWKCRHPAAVAQHRVPPDVIGMQVRAEHGIDLLGRRAGRAQPVEKRRLQPMEPRQPGPLFVIAGAAVDKSCDGWCGSATSERW